MRICQIVEPMHFSTIQHHPHLSTRAYADEAYMEIVPSVALWLPEM